MTIKDQVLKACISVATNQNHGHMTVKIVFNHLVNLGVTDYTRSQVSKCLSGHPNWWRQGLHNLPKKMKNSCLIRELKEELWQNHPSPEQKIELLTAQLIEVSKQRDAMQSEVSRLLLAVQNLEQDLKDIRLLWRNFDNMMRPGR